jgi:hypothetical protein
VTGWLVPLLVRRSQYGLGGTFHRRRSRLLKKGFFRAGKGAENTKEKSRQCFTVREGRSEKGMMGSILQFDTKVNFWLPSFLPIRNPYERSMEILCLYRQ